MLSVFTVALISLFVVMTWFETPVSPLVRRDEPAPAPPRPDEENHSNAA